MKFNYWKAGILITVLMVPALFFVFLKVFGTNHFTLRTYYPKIDSLTGEPIIRKVVDAGGREAADTLFHTVPDFSLTNQNGQPINGSGLKGKIHIADFFFTRCGTICPKLSSQMSRVQDIFRDKNEVVLVSYSVDPEHDTPEKLKQYAQKFEAIPGKWTFLTGDKQTIYTLAQKGYFLPVVDAGVSNGKPDETFIHTEKLVLVDKEGHIRGYYDGTDKEDVDRLILETRVLLDIYQKQ